MKIRHALRFPLALVLLIPAAVMVAGCSKSPMKVKPRPIVAHDQADFVVQQIGTTISADNGGWYVIVKVFAESLNVPPHNLVTGPPGRWSVPLSSRMGTLNDWSIVKAGLTYSCNVGYFHDSTFFATRDSATLHLEAHIAADGGVFIGTPPIGINGMTEGSYGLHAGIKGDSSLFISNWKPDSTTSGDTLEFSASVDDSVFGKVFSYTTGDSVGHYWYQTNFFDFTLHLLKSTLVPNPYPVDGEVTWLIEAFPLNSPRRNDFDSDIFAEARMTFDGTPNARLDMYDTPDDPAYLWSYTVNLNTGRITRRN